MCAYTVVRAASTGRGRSGGVTTVDRERHLRKTSPYNLYTGYIQPSFWLAAGEGLAALTATLKYASVQHVNRTEDTSAAKLLIG